MKKGALLALPMIFGQVQGFCDFKEVKWTYYTNSDCNDVDLDASEMA